MRKARLREVEGHVGSARLEEAGHHAGPPDPAAADDASSTVVRFLAFRLVGGAGRWGWEWGWGWDALTVMRGTACAGSCLGVCSRAVANAHSLGLGREKGNVELGSPAPRPLPSLHFRLHGTLDFREGEKKGDSLLLLGSCCFFTLGKLGRGRGWFAPKQLSGGW